MSFSHLSTFQNKGGLDSTTTESLLKRRVVHFHEPHYQKYPINLPNYTNLFTVIISESHKLSELLTSVHRITEISDKSSELSY